MKKPLFTIIVLAYNEEKTIRECIKSLKKQTSKNFEIMVVNNNSTDRTAEIAKKEVKNVILEKRQGYIYAFNAGAKKAKGEFIAAADADSIYPRDWLEKAEKWIRKKPEIAGVYGSTKFHDAPGIVSFFSNVIFSMFLRFTKLLGQTNTPGYNFIMRRRAYYAAGGYNPRRYAGIQFDFELGNRMAKKGSVILDTSNVVQTSARRFKKNGYIKTALEYIDGWRRLHYGKKQKISYAEYNLKAR